MGGGFKLKTNFNQRRNTLNPSASDTGNGASQGNVRLVNNKFNPDRP